jgi:hypothetical protein
MRITSYLLAATIAAFGATGVLAADTTNPCKGLANQACTGNTSCSWVKPYKIKKSGKEVAGFCRKKPTRSAAPAKKST